MFDKESYHKEEVQESIQRRRMARKKLDSERKENGFEEYKHMHWKWKVDGAKAKQEDQEKDLYRLARKYDSAAKDMQQARRIIGQ